MIESYMHFSSTTKDTQNQVNGMGREREREREREMVCLREKASPVEKMKCEMRS